MYNSGSIYIYAVELLSGPSLGVLEVIIWSKFVFLKHRLQQNTIKNSGFSTCLEKCAQNNWKLLSGPSWLFLRRTNLDQIITSNLDQVVLPNMSIFCFEQCAEIPIFTVFFNNQEKLAKNAKRNDNFSHFAKHRLIKTPFCCTPSFFFFLKNCVF